MSNSVPIPQRQPSTPATAHSSSMSSSYSSSASSSGFSRLMTSSGKGKAAMSSSPPDTISPRRPSLLGSSLARSEHTVINLAHHDGPPRLLTCLKSSQGFDWNQELFLPSYASGAHDLELKQDPVEDIILSDEEADAMLPT